MDLPIKQYITPKRRPSNVVGHTYPKPIDVSMVAVKKIEFVKSLQSRQRTLVPSAAIAGHHHVGGFSSKPCLTDLCAT